jgi:hypothetical protein
MSAAIAARSRRVIAHSPGQSVRRTAGRSGRCAPGRGGSAHAASSARCPRLWVESGRRATTSMPAPLGGIVSAFVLLAESGARRKYKTPCPRCEQHCFSQPTASESRRGTQISDALIVALGRPYAANLNTIGSFVCRAPCGGGRPRAAARSDRYLARRERSRAAASDDAGRGGSPAWTFGGMALFTVVAIITSFWRRHHAGSERRLLMRRSALRVEG